MCAVLQVFRHVQAEITRWQETRTVAMPITIRWRWRKAPKDEQPDTVRVVWIASEVLLGLIALASSYKSADELIPTLVMPNMTALIRA
ncbi:hypothetical protein RRG08_020137 [Elysia crispata]|uniref:Uncharacterized protein n=1 Tax=Elysia crispata TaxID=231223 RepID=A0AAE1E9E2_9GAST|nr:hypothetical protein RRG08_020137 [Elysia crispata]